MIIWVSIICFIILLSTINKVADQVTSKMEQVCNRPFKYCVMELVELKKTLLEHEKAGKNILNTDFNIFNIILDYKNDHPLANRLSRKQLYENRDILNQVDIWCDMLDDLSQILDIIPSDIHTTDDSEIRYILDLIKSCEIIIDRSRTIFNINMSFCNECNEAFCTIEDIFCPECGK